MKGVWSWPADAEGQSRVLRKIATEDELAQVLIALAANPDGLSNSQLDRMLGNNSQWRTLSHTRELAALGFIEYQVPYFGDPGKYTLTELGRSVLPRIQAGN